MMETPRAHASRRTTASDQDDHSLAAFRLGSDVGGTFTDLVIISPDHSVSVKKVLSSPPDFSDAISRGARDLLQASGLAGDQVGEHIHAATVATNAIITRTGAAVGLLTTKGFRDVLEIRRLRLHKLYSIGGRKPEPLVPRHRRLEVVERINAAGEELIALDETSARRAIQELRKGGVNAIAVCFLHAYANPDHERRTRELILEEDPSLYVSLSHEVLPEAKEYERTSTTVINAYVQPVVATYFSRVQNALNEYGVKAPMMVMQSSGGMTSIEVASRLPSQIVESGPAAGVTGAFHLSSHLNFANVITLDMGGTTAKAALIEGGEVNRAAEYEVGGEISIGQRLIKGGGYVLRLPSIDIAEVGVGGGSIAWLDAAGALKVGPSSAGAAPGPACYGLGGAAPTVTDANVVLGFTNGNHLAGGTFPIHPQLAQDVIRETLAEPLGIEVHDLAWSIRAIASSHVIRALRAVSIERGREPSDFVLFAFGGMGPVHAVQVAEELEITTIVIPPLPGVFSALSLLFADVEHHLTRPLHASMRQLDLSATRKLVRELLEEGTQQLSDATYRLDKKVLTLYADLRYEGQDFALTIPLSASALSAGEAERLITAFHEEHERTFSYADTVADVRISALRCVARGTAEARKLPPRLRVVTASGSDAEASRRCYLGPRLGWMNLSVVSRAGLEAAPAYRRGPFLLEEDTSLTVVPPGWSASLDTWSNVILRTDFDANGQSQ